MLNCDNAAEGDWRCLHCLTPSWSWFFSKIYMQGFTPWMVCPVTPLLGSDPAQHVCHVLLLGHGLRQLLGMAPWLVACAMWQAALECKCFAYLSSASGVIILNIITITICLLVGLQALLCPITGKINHQWHAL